MEGILERCAFSIKNGVLKGKRLNLGAKPPRTKRFGAFPGYTILKVVEWIEWIYSKI